MMHILPRHELEQPGEVPWIWRSWEVKPELQKPYYARLRNGHWFKCHHIEGDLIQGEVIPWKAFSLMMAIKWEQYRALYAVYAAFISMLFISVVICIGALSLVVHAGPQQETIFQKIIVGVALIAAFIFGVCAWEKHNLLQLMTVCDPGPEPLDHSPRAVVEREAPHGRGGFEDPAGAVRAIGGRGPNMFGGIGHGPTKHLGQ